MAKLQASEVRKALQWLTIIGVISNVENAPPEARQAILGTVIEGSTEDIKEIDDFGKSSGIFGAIGAFFGWIFGNKK
jgi:hypothetical protein